MMTFNLPLVQVDNCSSTSRAMANLDFQFSNRNKRNHSRMTAKSQYLYLLLELTIACAPDRSSFLTAYLVILLGGVKETLLRSSSAERHGITQMTDYPRGMKWRLELPLRSCRGSLSLCSAT